MFSYLDPFMGRTTRTSRGFSREAQPLFYLFRQIRAKPPAVRGKSLGFGMSHVFPSQPKSPDSRADDEKGSDWDAEEYYEGCNSTRNIGARPDCYNANSCQPQGDSGDPKHH